MMEDLQADASRLLAEYDSSNSAGNRLQRRLLSCEHAFHLLTDRFCQNCHYASSSLASVLNARFHVDEYDVLNRAWEKQIKLGQCSFCKKYFIAAVI